MVASSCFVTRPRTERNEHLELSLISGLAEARMLMKMCGQIAGRYHFKDTIFWSLLEVNNIDNKTELPITTK